MKVSGIILLAGIVLLLSGPLVALTPLFTPPSNGCPCPEGLNVSTPFGGHGILVGVIGTALIFYGGVRRRRGAIKEQATTSPHEPMGNAITALLGIVLLISSIFLSEIDLAGPGWQIYLYDGQAFYLGTLGVGMLLFAGFAVLTRKRASALFLAVGVVLCGVSLLFSSLAYSDFLPRCSPDVGCSPALAISTVSKMLNLGYLLAAGAFLLAVGTSIFFESKKNHGVVTEISVQRGGLQCRNRHNLASVRRTPVPPRYDRELIEGSPV